MNRGWEVTQLLCNRWSCRFQSSATLNRENYEHECEAKVWLTKRCDEHELANLDEMFHERIVVKNWKVPILIPVPL